MALAKVKITGDKRLLNMLRELPKRAGRVVNRRAVNLATTPILAACRDAAPVGEGDLRKSLIKKVTNRGLRADGIVGADAGYVTAEGKMPSKYDHLVEYGHANPDGSVTTPDPFLHRGWDDSIATARAAYESTLASGIDAEAAKLGGG